MLDPLYLSGHGNMRRYWNSYQHAKKYLLCQEDVSIFWGYEADTHPFRYDNNVRLQYHYNQNVTTHLEAIPISIEQI